MLGVTELLRPLGTLTRNPVRLPIKGEHSVIRYADPTLLQHKAFEPLGANPTRSR